MSKLKNQSGFSAVEAIVILLIIVLIGGAGYMVYKNHHKSTAPAKGSVTQTTNRSQKVTTAVSQGYFAIKEWGMRTQYSGNINYVYTINTDSKYGLSYASFSSTQLIAADSKCGVNTSPTGGGIIERFPPEAKMLKANGAIDKGETAAQYATTDKTAAHVGNFYYVYYQPQGNCSNSTSVQNIQGNTLITLYNFLPNLEAIPSSQ